MGAILGITPMVYIQDHQKGWSWGSAVPTVFSFSSILILTARFTKYRFQKGETDSPGYCFLYVDPTCTLKFENVLFLSNYSKMSYKCPFLFKKSPKIVSVDTVQFFFTRTATGPGACHLLAGLASI